MFVYFKSNSNPGLCLIIHQTKLKSTDLLINKLMSMRLDLGIYNIVCLFVDMCKIYLYKLEI